MSTETESTIPLEIEATEEALELDPKPEKRGFESLRGVRRSTYMRRSLLRMLSKAPEELAAYSPRNGFEMIARNMVIASNSKDRSGAVAVAVFRECKESLGERIGSNWKATAEERDRQNAPRIINDLPFADLPILKAEDGETSSRSSEPRCGRCTMTRATNC